MRCGAAVLAFTILATSGCARTEVSSRSSCVEGALDQPGLSDGVAVFTAEDGTTQDVHSGWLNLKDGDSVLDMASLTKPLVAAEIRRRIGSGQLGLNQPIGELLPEERVAPETGSITLRQLLQHQAGFDRSTVDPLFLFSRPSCVIATQYVLRRAPDKVAGQQVIYSNAGYCILGQILMKHPEGIDPGLLRGLQSPLGAAGGWRGTLREFHAAVSSTMPLAELSPDPGLPDGSHYAYAWRSWPANSDGPRWSHFGRLPGMVSLAVSDGKRQLLVAHFKGDPEDVDRSSLLAAKALWHCMR